jgi:hypothetical protein
MSFRSEGAHGPMRRVYAQAPPKCKRRHMRRRASRRHWRHGPGPRRHGCHNRRPGDPVRAGAGGRRPRAGVNCRRVSGPRRPAVGARGRLPLGPARGRGGYRPPVRAGAVSAFGGARQDGADAIRPRPRRRSGRPGRLAGVGANRHRPCRRRLAGRHAAAGRAPHRRGHSGRLPLRRRGPGRIPGGVSARAAGPRRRAGRGAPAAARRSGLASVAAGQVDAVSAA